MVMQHKSNQVNMDCMNHVRVGALWNFALIEESPCTENEILLFDPSSLYFLHLVLFGLTLKPFIETTMFVGIVVEG